MSKNNLPITSKKPLLTIDELKENFEFIANPELHKAKELLERLLDAYMISANNDGEPQLSTTELVNLWIEVKEFLKK